MCVYSYICMHISTSLVPISIIIRLLLVFSKQGHIFPQCSWVYIRELGNYVWLLDGKWWSNLVTTLRMSWKLTHWGRVTHICVSKLTIIGSDNGLSPGRRQAIIWTNAGILLIGPLRTNFNEISIEIHTFSFKKICLKLSSAKWRPFCPGLNVLMELSWYVQNHFSFTVMSSWAVKSTPTPPPRNEVSMDISLHNKWQRLLDNAIIIARGWLCSSNAIPGVCWDNISTATSRRVLGYINTAIQLIKM